MVVAPYEPVQISSPTASINLTLASLTRPIFSFSFFIVCQATGLNDSKLEYFYYLVNYFFQDFLEKSKV